MKEIVITVNQKIATAREGDYIVNGNSDVAARFVFDGDWADDVTKTAVFVLSDGSAYYEVLKDNTCVVPVLYNTAYVKIGVRSGEVCTSTSATVKCLPCVSDDADTTAPSVSKETYDILCNLIDARVPENNVAGQVLVSGAKGTNRWGASGQGGVSESGATFTPSVSADGVLSWTNDKELENPAPVNIKGTDGEDGYTPQKGFDYWTESDKEEINHENIAFISSELAKREQLKPEFANRIEECTDQSKLYVLPDGYLYAYMYSKIIGEESTFGTPHQSGFAEVGEGKNIYAFNKIGAQLTGSLKSIRAYTNKGGMTGTFAIAHMENGVVESVDEIPVTVRIGNNEYINGIDFNYSGTIKEGDLIGFRRDVVIGIYSGTYVDGSYATQSFDDLTLTSKGYSFSLTAIVKTDDVEGYSWSNTGHAFVPADYEDRINVLEDKVEQMGGMVASSHTPYFKVSGGNMGTEIIALDCVNDIKTGYRYTVTADFDVFYGMELGQLSVGSLYNTDDERKATVMVGRMYVTLFDANGVPEEIPHGLNINNSVTIVLEGLDNEDCRITVYSDGSSFTVTTGKFKVTAVHRPFAASKGMTNSYSFTWSNPSLYRDVWLFGDSYFTFDRARWMYYLMESDYAKNALVNGVPGDRSLFAKESLDTCLEVSKPKYLIWCLGMNDGADSEGSPSANWTAMKNKLIEYQNKYGFKLVFATIPSVPVLNHENKNDWVRNSGYQYIDFAAAVGATADGAWYDGMLSPDGIHPTEKGAMALYARFMADFPQIMKG